MSLYVTVGCFCCGQDLAPSYNPQPSTNFSILNLSPAELPALLWSVLIFSCCYFYSMGNQSTCCSDFFCLKNQESRKTGQEGENVYLFISSLLDGS